MAARIRKGDTVEVLKGRSRGQRGVVLRVERDRNRVVVERVNLVKRHQRAGGPNRQGGIIEKEAPVDLSNVALVRDGKRTRVGFRQVEGRKLRWDKKGNEAIDG
jgi:large subunit ribosomal protein L24